MTDAGSIWESKLSRLQDPNLQEIKPLVERIGEFRESRQERGGTNRWSTKMMSAHCLVHLWTIECCTVSEGQV
jgi:hypothetical protein